LTWPPDFNAQRLGPQEYHKSRVAVLKLSKFWFIYALEIVDMESSFSKHQTFIFISGTNECVKTLQ
jgi:hypothetical protein